MPSSTAGGVGFLDPQTIVAVLGITKGMKIADLGSGSGDFTIILAKMVGEDGVVSAVDVMEDKLESVRAKAQFAGVNNIQTIRANLEVLGSTGLSDNSQDLVLLANVLFQSNDKLGILTESSRVLNENGKLVIVEWRPNEGEGVLKSADFMYRPSTERGSTEAIRPNVMGRASLGPPDNLRIDSNAMRDLATSSGFTFERTVDAGIFHYGLIFNKIR